MKLYRDDMTVEINGCLKESEVVFDIEDGVIDTIYHVWIVLEDTNCHNVKVDAREFVDDDEIRVELEKKRKEYKNVI